MGPCWWGARSAPPLARRLRRATCRARRGAPGPSRYPASSLRARADREPGEPVIVRICHEELRPRASPRLQAAGSVRCTREVATMRPTRGGRVRLPPPAWKPITAPPYDRARDERNPQPANDGRRRRTVVESSDGARRVAVASGGGAALAPARRTAPRRRPARRLGISIGSAISTGSAGAGGARWTGSARAGGSAPSIGSRMSAGSAGAGGSAMRIGSGAAIGMSGAAIGLCPPPGRDRQLERPPHAVAELGRAAVALERVACHRSGDHEVEIHRQVDAPAGERILTGRPAGEQHVKQRPAHVDARARSGNPAGDDLRRRECPARIIVRGRARRPRARRPGRPAAGRGAGP